MFEETTMRLHRSVPLLALLLLFSSPLRASTPRIDSVNPPQVFAGADTRVTLTGAGFDPGSGVALQPGGPFTVGSIFSYQTRDVAASGNFAYVIAQNPEFQVIDVSNPQTPATVSVNTSGSPTGVTVAGDHAYVTGWIEDSSRGILEVVDVSDAQAPSITGSIDLSSMHARGIAVAGDFAYVAGSDYFWGTGKLQVIDVSDPQAPVLAGSIDLGTLSASGIAVAGDLAYVVGSEALQAINVSNPQAPALAGRIDTLGSARDVAVGGDFAYVASDHGLEVIDVRNPLALTVASRTASPISASGVAVAGNFAYLAAGRLEVFDISDPRAPIVASRVTQFGYRLFTVAVAGNHAYVAEFDMLNLIDVSEPKSPANLVGRVDPPGRAERVVTVGNYTYLAAGENGLQVIDVSDPQAPFVAGQVDTPGWAHSVAVAGNYAYVADGETEDGLRVIDISNPQAPVVVSASYTYGGDTTGVALAGNFAYLAVGEWGLEVHDITDPRNAGMVYQYPTCHAKDVTIAGNYAYLLCSSPSSDDKLQVFDISDPYAPVLAGSTGYSTLGSIWDFAVSGSYAYVVSYDSQYSSFWVIDFSNPQAPEYLVRQRYGGRYTYMPTLSSVAVDGDHAYVEVEGVLDVFDVSDPRSPGMAYRIGTLNDALDVAVAGNYGYAAGDHGLDVIQLNPELRDVNVVPDSTIELTVPAGFAKGPYHVGVTNIPELPNGLHVTDRPSYPLAATLAFTSDRSTITWGGSCATALYDVARGLVGDLPNFALATCFENDRTDTSTPAGADPPVGSAYYYVVSCDSPKNWDDGTQTGIRTVTTCP